MYEHFTPAAAKSAVCSRNTANTASVIARSAKKRPFPKKGPLFEGLNPFSLADIFSIVIR